MKGIKTQKTQITTYFDEGESPLRDDGTLLVDTDASAWLEPGDFKVIELSDDELTIEIEHPATSCRFLGISQGSAPACYGFGNIATNGRPWWMESAPANFAPEVICLHCQLYAGEWEARKHPRASVVISSHGYSEELPELDRKELGAYQDAIQYVDRKTGKVT